MIKKVCILGGSGFVGHSIGAQLAARKIPCRIVTRHPHRHRDLRVLPGVELFQAEQLDTATLQNCFAGCDAVINLVGILNEHGENAFRRLHVELVEHIIEAGRNAGIARLLHMSALHASAGQGTSDYLRSKGEGENTAHTRGHAAMKITSFRPSVIFGPGDSFFNRFASLLHKAPGVFPLACPQARFQPVYVGDVAAAFVYALDQRGTWERHYDLCGPRVYTLKELVEYTAQVIGKRVSVVGLNEFMSRTQARILQRLPGKPFTLDNYQSLQIDSVCQHDHLAELGITPTDIESQVPLYLGQAAQRSRYSQLRRVV